MKFLMCLVLSLFSLTCFASEISKNEMLELLMGLKPQLEEISPGMAKTFYEGKVYSNPEGQKYTCTKRITEVVLKTTTEGNYLVYRKEENAHECDFLEDGQYPYTKEFLYWTNKMSVEEYFGKVSKMLKFSIIETRDEFLFLTGTNDKNENFHQVLDLNQSFFWWEFMKSGDKSLSSISKRTFEDPTSYRIEDYRIIEFQP